MRNVKVTTGKKMNLKLTEQSATNATNGDGYSAKAAFYHRNAANRVCITSRCDTVLNDSKIPYLEAVYEKTVLFSSKACLLFSGTVALEQHQTQPRADLVLDHLVCYGHR